MKAAIPEADSGLRHQILDRTRNQNFAGTRFGGEAYADVKREIDHLRPAHLVFASASGTFATPQWNSITSEKWRIQKARQSLCGFGICP